MANAPTVNTNSWRLPKKAHSAPEATFTDEMYRRKGLPVAPDPTPTTGGSGLPTVSTEDWRLPKKGERPIEESAPGVNESGCGGGGRKSLLKKTTKRRQPVGPPRAADDDAANESVDDRKLVADLGVLAHRLEKGASDGYTLVRDLKHILRRMRSAESAPVREVMQTMKVLDTMVKRTRGTIDAAQAKHSAANLKMAVKTYRAMSHSFKDQWPPSTFTNESLTDRMRRLSGLVESGDRPFAMGTPHRHMPDPEVPRVIAEAAPPRPMTESNGKWPRSQMSRGGFGNQTPEEKAYNVVLMAGSVAGGAEDAKALLKKLKLPFKKFVLHVFDSEVGNIVRGARPHSGTRNDPKAEMMHLKRAAQALGAMDLLMQAAKKHSPKKEQREQFALAGLTERSAMPHPMHDTRPVQRARAHGILDDGADAGESYVEQVLAESRWFFGGEGPQRPFDEAPGGRAGPWRGSDDEPAPTPIVRKGKVHGQIGKHKTPEEGGEVDVGKSEIDYDKTPGDDDEEKKAKAKSRGKAPPEDDEEEPEPEEGPEDDEEPEDEGPEDPDQDEEEDEDDEDEEEEEEQDEWIGEAESRAGNVARRTGGLIKRVGGAIQHGGSKMDRASHWLKSGPVGGGRKKKGKKKPGAPKPKAKKTPARKPSPVKAAAKPKTKPKPLKPKPRPPKTGGGFTRKGDTRSRHSVAKQKAKLTKSGKAPKLKKMKRRLRERLALLVAASASLL